MCEWKCKRCGTTDKELQYPSGKMNKCKDCQRWYNITVNSKRKRKYKKGPELNMTEEEFLKWCRSQERKCDYCGIKEQDLQAAGLLSSIGLPVYALGIDRIDSERGYEVDNITFCCYACNKAKGDVYTYDEFKIIGESISKVWKDRGIGSK